MPDALPTEKSATRTNPNARQRDTLSGGQVGRVARTEKPQQGRNGGTAGKQRGSRALGAGLGQGVWSDTTQGGERQVRRTSPAPRVPNDETAVAVMFTAAMTASALPGERTEDGL